jgi:protease-4
MEKNRIGCFSIGLVIVLCLSLFFNVLLMFAGVFKASFKTNYRPLGPKAPRFDEATVVDATGSSSDKIALIPLHGIISSSMEGALGGSMVEDIKIALQQAAEDSNVKAIVLDVDSPGGEVTASDVIYNAVKSVRDKSHKPVVVYMDSLAASGGYYVSCAGSHIIANETTLTGSIGVIIETLNYQQLMGKIGVDTVVFKSGKMKDMLSGSRTMTDEEKQYIQGLVMQTYDKFVGIVATERKLDVEKLKSGIADGRVISGKDAVGEKLIDGLGQIEDAYEKAKNLGHAPGAAVIRYESAFRFGKLLKLLGKTEVPKIEVKLPQELTSQLQPGRLYLLPSTFAQ